MKQSVGETKVFQSAIRRRQNISATNSFLADGTAVLGESGVGA